jgi:uncharacterized membrane protein YeaQ/YmgE (transglycosylase-associated protein family)
MTGPTVSLLLTLFSGAVSGDMVGALIKDQSLAPTVNTILGLIGGVGGSQLPGALASSRPDREHWNVQRFRVVLPIIIGILQVSLQKPEDRKLSDQQAAARRKERMPAKGHV